ncbi:hypothetical protein FE257_000144 [Aspergillus nanangensis]|uniref:Uncharacterized protein n=1 Tax=Aspergillus nanangensis TaxID=2582783 RepID=A0AAD4GZN5_ASPNN|nr:hypothetical protein FE257_000144 [Aspergillus nanangensis]
MNRQTDLSHISAFTTLADILADFQIPLPSTTNGPEIILTGEIPSPELTKSQRINLTLIGAIPALANAVVAATIFEARGGSRQRVEIDLRRGHNYIDPDIGMTPSLNGQEITLDLVAGNPFLRNIFETRDGKWVVLSAVYVDLAYKWTALLDCSMAESSARAAVKMWNAADLEALAAKAEMPMAICRSEKEWNTHPQGSVMTGQPIVPIEPAKKRSSPSSNCSPFPATVPDRPLSGLKVLAVTHAIAGPGAGRTLAEHGASVLQVMFTHGFEHAFVYTYANLGTASTRLSLNKDSDRQRLWTLIRDAHVWIDSYREGAIRKFGYSDTAMHNVNPGLIITHIRCYGSSGPWAWKPGFDMQGSASSGLMCLMGEGLGDGRPRWPPGMVINDYTTAYFAALAVMGIVLRRVNGESDWDQGWVVSPSLCGTAMGILRFFKTERFPGTGSGEPLSPEMLEGDTSLGYLKTLAPLPKMSATPVAYQGDLLVTMGSSRPVFPGFDDGYDIRALTPMSKEGVVHSFAAGVVKKLERIRMLGEEERKARDKAYDIARKAAVL